MQNKLLKIFFTPQKLLKIFLSQPKLLTILLASLFSLILWVFVSFSNDYTATFRIPIEFTNIKEGNSLLSQSASEIAITVSGEGWSLAQITFGGKNQFKISTNENVGLQNYIVRDAISGNEWLSPSIQVVSVSPLNISYSVERLNYKVVPLNADITLGISEGYDLVSKIKLSPDSVKISGPKSLVKSIQSISTEKFKFDNLDAHVSTLLKLKSTDYISFENNMTNIDFSIEKIVDKTFHNIPIKIINIPNLRELDLFPPNVDITLRGGLESLGIQDIEGISAVVDFKDAFIDTLGFVKAQISIPGFTKLTNVKPDKLKYIIKQY